MGWDNIDNVNIDVKELETGFDDHAIKVFGRSTEGKAFLEFLKKKFLTATVMTPENIAAYGYWREGQNSLVRRIIHAVERDFVKRSQTKTTKGEKK